eukprot:TRINITY_DN10455_c0_g1_i2.p1 TRINITY_DN10455_c0_g1~~TRINITY_DN10455_c0_g1_i2.p1  ORF type:complete len:187 (+),score=56.56 TRINITY_DN10455_c0_g1_i2:221-781(+)
MPTPAMLRVFLCIIFLFFSNLVVAISPERFVYNEQENKTNLLQKGQVLEVSNGSFPRNIDEIDGWLQGKQAQTRTTFFGGSFWFVIHLENKTALEELVLYPYNTLLSKIETRIYDMSDAQKPVKRYETGGLSPNEFAFHYGNKVQLAPNTPYMLIAKFQSDYFYTPPHVLCVDTGRSSETAKAHRG